MKIGITLTHTQLWRAITDQFINENSSEISMAIYISPRHQIANILCIIANVIGDENNANTTKRQQLTQTKPVSDLTTDQPLYVHAGPGVLTEHRFNSNNKQDQPWKMTATSTITPSTPHLYYLIQAQDQHQVVSCCPITELYPTHCSH